MQRQATDEWNRLFEKYGEQVLNYPADPWILRNLDRLGSPKKGFLVDAGCGWGRHLLEAAQRGWRVIGIDSSNVALVGLAKRISTSIRTLCCLVCADLTQQVLASNTCDAGICADVLSIVHSPDRVLKVLRAYARESAILLVTLQNIQDETCGHGQLTGRKLGEWLQFLQDGIRYRFYTRQGINLLVDRCGWRLHDIEEFGRTDPAHAHRPYSHVHVFFGCVIRPK